MTRVAGPTAALAGTPAGVRGEGVWTGRRQLFVRFAEEAETATMYTAQALANELRKAAERSVFHSLSFSGRDTLGNGAFIEATFEVWKPAIPVMLETDGQRPDAVVGVSKDLDLLQVRVVPGAANAVVDRAMETLAAARDAECSHALVLCPREDTSDAQILRLVERAHGLSADTAIVIHPHSPGDKGLSDRRWSVLLEQAVAMHGDVILLPRLAPPLGMR